jgi:hypothetical protein
MEVTLWGEQIGRKDLKGRRIGQGDFPNILRCLSPAESSQGAAKMMVLPLLGSIRIKLRHGRERHVEFVDSGKNPLCFNLDGISYLRGGERYSRYLEDHRELYGLPAEYLDEAMPFADKLVALCLAGEPPG